METTSLTEKIGNLIAEDRIDQAIAEMKSLFGNSPRLNEVLLQSAMHKDVLRSINQGTISYENSNLTKNQIRFALLSILNDVDGQAADPVIAEEINRFEFSGQGNFIQQTHSGQGDNVGGDKIINTNYKVKAGFIIAAILLATAAVIFVPGLLPEVTPLSGYVVTSGGVPVKNAKVVFKDNNQVLESYTDVSGKFQFEDVDTKTTSNFQLTAFTDGRKVAKDTSGNEAGLNGIHLRLPPGDAPFDVSYYDLKEEAITWLVNGTRRGYVQKTGQYDGIDDTWEKTFRGKPGIINNPVLKELKKLYDTYGETWYTSLDDGYTDIPFVDYYNNQNEALTKPWANLINSDNWTFKGKPISAKDIKRIITEAPGPNTDADNFMAWHEEAMNYYGEKLNGAEISPSAEDLSAFVKNPTQDLLSFFSYIGREHIPTGFLNIQILNMVMDGCLEENAYYQYPKMTVQVAVLENNEITGIDLDSFYIQNNNTTGLRSVEEDDAALASVEYDRIKLYPRKRLPGKEKLMIPLRIIFESPEPMYGDAAQEKKYWVYGPSCKITKVDVGVERFAFRQKDPESLLIYNGEEIGSCPYAYTYNEKMEGWQLENHFLFNVNSREKERRDTIYLSQFDGQLKIKEIDPETSHIDLIEVHHISEQGTVTRFKTTQQDLATADEQYFIMNQGDEIILDFENYIPVERGNFFLISKGYYEVYEDLAPL